MPEEGEEKFTKRYIRINWQRELGDDRLFPELKYELLMSVEPNGKPMLLPDISDGDIIGYKIKQNYSSLISEKKDGDLVCSIKSKFNDMNSVESYVEEFNDNWDFFFLGKPESLILDITVDCLENEEWIRNEGFHLKNHIVYFKLIFQNTYLDFVILSWNLFLIVLGLDNTIRSREEVKTIFCQIFIQQPICDFR